MTNQNRAFLYAGLTVLLWSTIATALKLALAGMRPAQLILVAMLTAIFVQGGILLFRHLRRNFSTTQRQAAHLTGDARTRSAGAEHSTSATSGGGYRLGRADGLNILAQGIILYIYYTLLLNAFDGLPAQIAQPINSTWALVLALLSAWILRQKLSLTEFMFMLLAYCGVVIVATGGGSGELGPIRLASLACVMGSTVLNAIYWLVNAKGRAPQVLSLFLSFCVAATLAGVTLMFSSLASPGESALPASVNVTGMAGIPWLSLGAAVIVGLFELAIPFLLWSQALRLSSSVARVSTLSFLVPFLSLFWVSLVLREPIAVSTMIGLACIVGGTFLQQRAANRRMTKQTNSLAGD